MAMTYFGAEKILDHAVEMNQVADQPLHAFHNSVPCGTTEQEEVFHVEHSTNTSWNQGQG
jgi:hypothetical protein